MGHNIGMRIVEEFPAKAEIDCCSNFQQTSRTIAERAFSMFLGARGTARPVDNGEREAIITLEEHFLAEFADILP
jgi:trafficking protein particle complex subunit 3